MKIVFYPTPRYKRNTRKKDVDVIDEDVVVVGCDVAIHQAAIHHPFVRHNLRCRLMGPRRFFLLIYFFFTEFFFTFCFCWKLWIPRFTVFFSYLIFLCFYFILFFHSWFFVLPGAFRQPPITGFCLVLLGFTGFHLMYWVVSSFTGFDWVLLGLTWFYWVLLGATGCYLVVLDFT